MAVSYKQMASYVAIIAGLLLTGLLFIEHQADAAPASITIQTTAPATTTVAYIGVGTATSTYQFDNNVFSSGKIMNMQPIDRITLYVQEAASSTSSVIGITPQYSNNGIDWYSYGTATSSVSSTGATSLTTGTSYQWTPGTTATSSLVLVLPDVPTQHERVQFSATGAAAAVYAEVDMKRNAGGSQ